MDCTIVISFLVDFCNMCYRDDMFNSIDVILEFNDYGIDERNIFIDKKSDILFIYRI